MLYSSTDARWTETLTRFDVHDAYHLASYHRLAEEQGQGKSYLFTYDDGVHCTALPFLVRQVNEVPALAGSDRTDATSVYGYPGVLTTVEEGSAGAHRHRQNFQDALLAALAELGVVALFSRLSPLLPTNWMLQGVAQIVQLGYTVAIDLSQSEEAQLAQMTKGHRYDIRRAERLGVRVEHDEALQHMDEFIALYEETMRRVSAEGNYLFPSSYYRRLPALLGPALRLLVARQDERIVAASMFFATSTIAQYHLSGASTEGLELGAPKAILDTMRRWSAANGYRTLHLGGGVGAAEDPLFRFKAGFSKMRLRYSVARAIIDPSSYRQLCGLADVDDLQAPGFFPAYRRPAHSS